MTDGPYREAPCPACTAREEAFKKMLPFIEDRRKCPECASWSPTMWRTICHGSGKFLVTEGHNGFFGIGKTEPVTFECNLPNAPKHFHFSCAACNHRWMMLTATESPPK